MTEHTTGSKFETALNALDDRVAGAGQELKNVRSRLVAEVARRRRAEAEVARLTLEQEELTQDGGLKNPALAWSRFRSDLGVSVWESPRRIKQRLLAYYPGGQFNPYMEVLYSRCTESGISPVPLASFEDVEHLQSGDIFHLHWTKFVTSDAGASENANSRVARTLEVIDRAIERGVIFGWSVHERVPHECPYPEAEFALRRGLVDRAEFVHVLHSSTPGEVASDYEIPESKLLLVEHPLYSGFYPDFISRDAARAELGIGDEALFLSFGAIRPYKGIDRLEAAVAKLDRNNAPPFTLLVAGPTYSNVDVDGLLLDLASNRRTLLGASAVPATYVHVLFRAADVAVLPYREFHNSGVAMLALTFGTPVLVPDTPVTRELESSGLASYFDGSDEGLLSAMATLTDELPRRDRIAAGFSERFGPHKIAGEFAAAVGRLR